MKKFFICKICFLNVDSAEAAMAALAAFGIDSKIFDDISDPHSAAVFVEAWRAGDASFETVVTEIADQHNGSADHFGVADHEPVPADFGFQPEAA
jgi:hypothetical protein